MHRRSRRREAEKPWWTCRPDSVGSVRFASLDFLIYTFGAWTVGFWIALAFGLGWAFALAFAAAVGAGLIAWLRVAPAPRFDRTTERADIVPVALVLGIVVIWPIALDLGRSTLAVLALVLLGVRLGLPIVQRRFGIRDARLLTLGAMALIATLAYWATWWAFVVVVCTIALVMVLRPGWASWLVDSGADSAASPRRSSRR